MSDVDVTQTALPKATAWLSSILLGPAATGVAILAIAAVGLLMLSGRLPARRGVIAIVGCFILFSADTIANGLLEGVSGTPSPIDQARSQSVPYKPAVPTAQQYDPYAGASVPTRTSDVPIIR